MGRFLRMTITRRIQIGFAYTAVLVLMLVATVVAQTIWLQSWRSDYERSVAKTNTAGNVQVIILGSAAYGIDIQGLQTATRTELESLKEQIDSDFVSIAGYLNALETGAQAGAITIVKDMRGLTQQYQQGIQEVLTLATTDAVQAQRKLEETRPVLIMLEETVNAFVRAEKAVGDRLLERHESTSRTVMIVVIVLAALALPASVAGAVMISRTIGRQLRAAFAKLSSSAAELMAVSSQVAASASQTAASTSEATVTVEEVKQTALVASEKAGEVSEESKSLPQVAEAGRAAVEQTQAAFERTRDQMSAVSETISQLSERTEAVQEIIATVNDLAEQSNLLAVNASIEAAKAGEYGRGFTVVAQEVKSLSEQSKLAVVQARSVLGEIVKATGLATQAAAEGQETVESGWQQSAESGKAIYTLAESANKSAESAIQISASSRQQLAGMEQIGQVMESINQAGSQSAAGTRQVQQEVMHLQEVAAELRELVDSKASRTSSTGAAAPSEEGSA